MYCNFPILCMSRAYESIKSLFVIIKTHSIVCELIPLRQYIEKKACIQLVSQTRYNWVDTHCPYCIDQQTNAQHCNKPLIIMSSRRCSLVAILTSFCWYSFRLVVDRLYDITPSWASFFIPSIQMIFVTVCRGHPTRRWCVLRGRLMFMFISSVSACFHELFLCVYILLSIFIFTWNHLLETPISTAW